MFGDLFHDPFGRWGNMPEIPKPKDQPSENDIIAVHLIGCLYAIVGIALLIVFISIIYLLINYSGKISL